MTLTFTPKPEALQVAREFFALAKECNDPDFTTLKLQKLLYLAQAWSEYHRGRSMFVENVKAWDFGPVVPSIFQITKGYKTIQFSHEVFNQPSDLSEPDRELIFGLWQLYGHRTGEELSDLTHDHDAWKKAYANKHILNKSPKIDPADMRESISNDIRNTNRAFAAFLAGIHASQSNK